MDEDECIEVMLLDPNEAYQMIQQGIIKDSKTIIAVQQAMLEQWKGETSC